MNVVLAISRFLVLGLCLAHPSPEHTSISKTKSIHQSISFHDLRCDSSDKTIQKICKSALTQINAKLFEAAVSIDSNEFLFIYDDPEDTVITSRKCISRTYDKITHRHASIQFRRGGRLNLDIKSITQPSVLSIKLPVTLRASVDSMANFQVPRFGEFGGTHSRNCLTVDRQTYSFKDSANAIATIVITFTLNPKILKSRNGDYVVVIQPRFTSLFTLDDFKINFDVSEIRAPITIDNYVSGLGRTIIKSATDLVQGDKVSDTIDDAFPFTLNLPIVLGTGSLPALLEQLIRKKVGKRNPAFPIYERGKKYSYDLQESINSKLQKKLKLRSGLDYIVIKKD